MLPQTPTKHLPGSEAKLSVLGERAVAGLQLFHPQDAGLPKNVQAVVFTGVEGNSESDRSENYHRFLTALDEEINESR